MEVKDEEQVSPFEDDEFVSFVGECDVLVAATHPVEGLFEVVECLVEVLQLRESKILVVTEIPLSSAVVVAEVVACSWKVNPLWVTKLIAHEVKVGFSSQSDSD